MYEKRLFFIQLFAVQVFYCTLSKQNMGVNKKLNNREWTFIIRVK